MLHIFSASKQILYQKISKYTLNTTKNQNKIIYSQYTYNILGERRKKEREIDRERERSISTKDDGGQIGKERERYQRRMAAARLGGCGSGKVGMGLPKWGLGYVSRLVAWMWIEAHRGG